MSGKINKLNIDEKQKVKITMNQAEIIQLPLENWQEYKELRLRALQTDPQAFSEPYSRPVAWPDEKWQQRLQTANEGKTTNILFARLDGKLVGMVGFYRDENDFANHSAQIWGVYVDPEQRGKGIAKSLFSAILEKLTSNPDINLVKLEVNTDQESAKKLYASFGFVAICDRQLLLGDGLTHQITEMEKHLRDN